MKPTVCAAMILILCLGLLAGCESKGSNGSGPFAQTPETANVTSEAEKAEGELVIYTSMLSVRD